MTNQNLQLPEAVAQNLNQIKKLGLGHIAELINLRAGRMPEFKVKAKRVIDQFNLIESELIEGKKAAAEGNITQVRDAIADIMLLAMGQQSILGGVDVEADYRLMCAYNMTRIPQSMEEAVATVNKYDELGVQAYIDEVEVGGVMLYPVKTLASHEQEDFNGEHYAPNKFLKSVNFHDAAYAEIQYAEIKDFESEAVRNMVGNRFTKEHAAAVVEALGLDDNIEIKAINGLIGKRF